VKPGERKRAPRKLAPPIEGTGEYLAYEGLSRWLGIPKGTIASWVHRGLIPYLRLSDRVVRFERKAIVAWLGTKRIEVGVAVDQAGETGGAP
jgi:excisionase family DNA binding protein